MNCSARDRATEQHQLPSRRTTHLGQQTVLMSNCRADSCRWFIRWLNGSHVIQRTRTTPGEWNSLVLSFREVAHVDCLRSGPVRCCRIELYANVNAQRNIWNLLSQLHSMRLDLIESLHSQNFNNSLKIHLDKEAAGPRPEIRVL